MAPYTPEHSWTRQQTMTKRDTQEVWWMKIGGGYVKHIKHITHVKLYKDEEELYLSKSAGLTAETHKLIEKERERLLKEEGRKLSRAKIINNLIIEKYGN